MNGGTAYTHEYHVSAPFGDRRPTPTPTAALTPTATRPHRDGYGYTHTDANAQAECHAQTDSHSYAHANCDTHRPTPTPTPTPTPGSFAAVILATEPANLKGYWKCDETSGTTLVDSSGNSKNLTLHGVAGSAYSLAQSGEQGGSIRFYGTTNSYADRSDSPNSILGSSNLQNSNWTMFALVEGDAQAQSLV